MDRPGPPSLSADAVTTVAGTDGATYCCVDISAVDRHLADLCGRIARAAPGFPSLIECYRADIDLLLDRRCWLELFTGPRTAPPTPFARFRGLRA